MVCVNCSSRLIPVKTASPQMIVDIYDLDFVNCQEAVIWCCEICGYTRVTCVQE